MSMARTARRRRRQWAINHTHIARLSGRPIYKRKQILSVGEAIARERRAAVAEASRKRRG